jgi:hypothetical protein
MFEIKTKRFTCKILIKTTSSSLGFVPTKRVCVTAFATLSIADAADSPCVSLQKKQEIFIGKISTK